jgi:hypothetical protein
VIDIPSLERRWIKYKIKRILPYTLGIVTGISILFYALHSDNFTPPDSVKKEISLVKTTPKPSVPAQTREIIEIVPPAPVVAIQQQPIAVIAPVTHPAPVQQTVTWKPAVISAPKKVPVALVVPNIVPPKSAQITPNVTPVSSIVVKPNTRNSSVLIKQETTPFDIHEIEARFKNNSNPHLGLYIARYHYENGNYNEAYNYALKTNAINSSLEESWIIFAKSLVKLGRTDQAKKTLQLYISQSNSEEAKSLLNNLSREDEK